MNSQLSKIISVVSGIIGLVAVYFLVRIVMAGDESIIASPDLQASYVSPYIAFAKWILIITAVLAVVFSLWNLIKHPKMLVKTLVSIGALAVLLIIAYMLADGGAVTDMTGKVLPDGEAGPVSKWVSTGIWYSVILGGIGLLFFVWDFIKSLVKG